MTSIERIEVTYFDILPAMFEHEISFMCGYKECVNILIEHLKKYYELHIENGDEDKKCSITVKCTDKDDYIKFVFPMSYMGTACQWYEIIHNACR